mgnify:CR=1 FL=1
MPPQNAFKPAVLAAVLAAIEAFQHQEAAAALRPVPPPAQALSPWRLAGRSDLMQARTRLFHYPRPQRRG